MIQDECTRLIHSPPPMGEGTVMDSPPISTPDLSPFLRGVKALWRLQSFGTRPGHARLISIRYSHYNERARWALDLSPLRYTEDAHPPVPEDALTLVTVYLRVAMMIRRAGAVALLSPTASTAARASRTLLLMYAAMLPAKSRLLAEAV